MKTAIFRIFSLLFLLGAGAPLRAVADLGTSREALAELQQRVQRRTLPNGLRVVLHRRGAAPVFAGAVSVRVGGSDEPAGLTGISHMLEHMAFKGTDTIGTRDYQREKVLLAELEAIEARASAGTALSADEQKRRSALYEELKALWLVEDFSKKYEQRGGSGFNATTDKELTNYFVELPTNALEFWCWIESERILRPVMRQFYQERDVVMEERRMRYDDDPQGQLYERLLGTAFKVHPYRNPVIGYKEDLSRLTASGTDAFRRMYYVPANIVVSLVGDIDLDRAGSLVERYFGRIPAGEVGPRPSAVEPPQNEERQVSISMPASPYLSIAYHKPQYPHPDDPPISVMLEILAGGRLSPLYTELVKKRQVAASVSYGEAPGSAYPNLFMFSITPRAPHSLESVREAFDQVLEQFLAAPPSDEAMLIAKRSIAMEYLQHLQSNTGLALDFGSSELLYGDWRALVDWYERAIAVGTEDVARVARQYLVRSARTVGTVVPSSKSRGNSDEGQPAAAAAVPGEDSAAEGA